MQNSCLTALIGMSALLLSACNNDRSDASNIVPITVPSFSTPQPVVPVTGTVRATSNPLVAQVTVAAAPGAQVQVEFGTDTNYGRMTSTTVADASGNASILVAGLRGNTTYHLRTRVLTATATQTSSNETFTTGALPANLAALRLKVETPPGASPQPGIELVNPIASAVYQPYAVDLQGNIIWYYAWPDFRARKLVQGMKQLPNGNFLLVIADTSRQPLDTPTDRTASLMREINLAGDTVRELTIADLNAKIASSRNNLTLELFHHDVEILPNGNWLLLANTLKNVNGVNVLGDVIIEVDKNLNPVFVWNQFDHFDPTVRSMQYPNWTHTNAVVYSPTDGNFIVSMRHLHLVAKVNYRNGSGDGAVLWRLGRGGDFALRNGTDPIDWQYAQHTPTFTSAATAGVFDLILMDNGNERIIAGNGSLCGTTGNPSCYTTVPIFRVDEVARTATVTSRITLPPELFSSFAGNAAMLPNGNVKYALGGLRSGAIIREVSLAPGNPVVWSLTTVDNFAYRSERLPSLYPGILWR